MSSYITPPHQLRVTMRPGKQHEDLQEVASFLVGFSRKVWQAQQDRT